MPEFGGEALVYVSPDHPDGIRDGIVELLDDRDMAKQFTTKMARQVALYDWGRTAQRTWDALLSV
jgi:glycosyltransferase involved in cell wall biosynthesis